ncbi:phage holin family protein [Fusibacter sp. 3D3]|uniref:phage holin family protein n=1 Tax=Fusibacter sp. 3D3 TaxID=1048380 RepID=UPI0008531590|nr:phage holin family protein [Fusibacter sp. 3D3]GAU78206.1 putative membrane protein [Fusibacter sp. 3D3]
MKKLLSKWIIAAVSIYLASQVINGFQVSGWQAAFGAAFVFGLLNFSIKPILSILTFPVTLITFGLFLFVVNGILVYILGMLLKTVQVSSLWDAILASVVISVSTMVLNTIFGVKDRHKRD